MFDIFVKRKKVILDCFTNNPYAYNFAKIDHASKFFPDWWKNTPKTIEDGENRRGMTIKKCVGLQKYYARGLIIPSWFEMEIKISNLQNKKYEWKCSDPAMKIVPHPKFQYEEFVGNDGDNFKLFSCWLLQTTKKIDFVWSQPIWNNKNMMGDFILLPAVVDYYTQAATHINYLIKYSQNTNFIKIDPLDPLVILHPLTENEIELRHHFIDDLEFNVITKNVYGLFHSTDNVEKQEASSILKRYSSVRKKALEIFKDATDKNQSFSDFIKEKRNGKQK